MSLLGLISVNTAKKWDKKMKKRKIMYLEGVFFPLLDADKEEGIDKLL